MQTKQITQFSFWEFCVAVQEAIQEGYVFSTDNDKMPTAYVGNYSCAMVKKQEEIHTVLQPTSDTQDNTTQSKRGRKSTS